MKKFLLIMVMVFAISLAGCQTKQEATTPTTKPPEATQPNTPATTQKAEPPTQLNTIESNSKAIMGDIAKNDWTAAQNKVAAIKTDYDALKPMLVSAKAPDDTINSMGKAIPALDTAVKAKQSYEARVQANQITRHVADAYDTYKVTIPTDVSRLGYLVRDINLNVEKKDWTSAASNYDTLSKTWNTLKPTVNTSYQKDIDAFQTTMDRLKSAMDQKNANETNKQATALLENIDTITKDFNNKA